MTGIRSAVIALAAMTAANDARADPPARVTVPDTAAIAHDSAAMSGSFAIGEAVRDRSGALVGRLTRLTTDAQGQSVAKVRSGEDVFAIPVADLFERNGALLSTVSLDDLKHGRIAPSAAR